MEAQRLASNLACYCNIISVYLERRRQQGYVLVFLFIRSNGNVATGTIIYSLSSCKLNTINMNGSTLEICVQGRSSCCEWWFIHVIKCLVKLCYNVLCLSMIVRRVLYKHERNEQAFPQTKFLKLSIPLFVSESYCCEIWCILPADYFFFGVNMPKAKVKWNKQQERFKTIFKISLLLACV